MRLRRHEMFLRFYSRMLNKYDFHVKYTIRLYFSELQLSFTFLCPDK